MYETVTLKKWMEATSLGIWLHLSLYDDANTNITDTRIHFPSVPLDLI
jgi:hypothetical protein